MIAIIHAEEADIKKIASEAGASGSYEDLIKDEKVLKWFTDALETKRKESGFKGFERIVKVTLIKDTFESKDLLTTTFKVKRSECKEAFKETLDEMYKDLN